MKSNLLGSAVLLCCILTIVLAKKDAEYKRLKQLRKVDGTLNCHFQFFLNVFDFTTHFHFNFFHTFLLLFFIFNFHLSFLIRFDKSKKMCFEQNPKQTYFHFVAVMRLFFLISVHLWVFICLVGYVTVKPISATGVLPTWGTFRPNVYFGVKARVPKSPLFGIMWYDADAPDAHNRWFLNLALPMIDFF